MKATSPAGEIVTCPPKINGCCGCCSPPLPRGCFSPWGRWPCDSGDNRSNGCGSIQWTMLACLLAPLVNQLPGLPQWSVPVVTSLSQPTERAESAISSDAKPPVIVRNETPATIASQEIIQTESRSSEPTIVLQPIDDRSVDNTPRTHSRTKTFVPSPSPSAGEGRGEGALRTAQRQVATAEPTRNDITPSNAPRPPHPWSWPRIVLTAYAVGAVAMLVWYLIGFFALVLAERHGPRGARRSG